MYRGAPERAPDKDHLKLEPSMCYAAATAGGIDETSNRVLLTQHAGSWCSIDFLAVWPLPLSSQKSPKNFCK